MRLIAATIGLILFGLGIDGHHSEVLVVVGTFIVMGAAIVGASGR